MKKAAKKVTQAIVLSREEQDFERIRGLEVALHERAASILDYAMRAPELSQEDMALDQPPPNWAHDLGGHEEAKRAFRIAKAAWQSQKDAPVFLKIAPAFLAGSMKARAHADNAPRILNATIVQTTVPIPVFPERVLPNDDE